MTKRYKDASTGWLYASGPPLAHLPVNEIANTVIIRDESMRQTLSGVERDHPLAA
jgi:hypothetical protein